MFIASTLRLSLTQVFKGSLRDRLLGTRVGERRGERRSVCSVCLVSLETSLENSPSSSPRRAIVSLSVVPRRKAILPLRGSSLSVDRRRNDNSLSLRGSSRKQRRSYLSLGCCRRGRKSLIISLTVGILDGEEPLSLSLSLWINWNRKVRLFLLVALVDGDIWLSVDGSPQRRRCSLSMALRDSVRDKQAFDMFGGKRAQGGSSIKG
ncbi:hypothetical protein DY000_02017797 [Brassica cretica]|uniref:Uncharacterized protein n=1 Tax=Brassica cretica TaxID=69181 RepID=A0ABQ7DEG7_BRACR|nr:hypothetical protein DY000_02017797 [Brassica cretica]